MSEKTATASGNNPGGSREARQGAAGAVRPAVLSAVLSLDGRPVRFATARARVEDRGSVVAVQLSAESPQPPNSPEPPDTAANGAADDPAHQIDDAGGAGNNFFFDMVLDIDDASQLDGAEWHFKALDREPAESPDGLLLAGGQRLQPYDVTVRFVAEGAQDGTPLSHLAATIEGQFLLFTEAGGAVAEKTVDVKGTVRAVVEK